MSISSEATLEQRRQLIAYATLFACAVYATALPNALIPDRLLNTHQLLNLHPDELQTKQQKRWLIWMLTVSLPVGTIAFADIQSPLDDLTYKTTLAISYLLIVSGMGFYAFHVYFLIGPVSQQWQEGTAGGWWDRIKSINPAIETGTPRGLLPALTATTRVFGLGVLVVVASMYFGRLAGPYHTAWPGVLILALGLRRMYQDRSVFDRYYYHTNAFFSEILRSGSFSSTVKETTAYDALYWVPIRWRAHVWASFVQLERAIPLGRFVVLAILILWILSWRNVTPAVFSACLMLFVVAKNLSILGFTRHDLAPPQMNQFMQSSFNWGITRGFVNLKWTLPLIVGLLPVGWLDTDFSFAALWKWALIDSLCAFIFAMGVTYGTAYRTRNAFSG